MNIYRKLVKKYGILSQLMKMIEEITELVVALAKENKEEIIEELVDVSIMIEQFREMLIIIREEYSIKSHELHVAAKYKLLKINYEHLEKKDGE